MRIVILKFPYVDPDFCEKICDMAERLEYDIAGIVSFDVNEKLTAFRNYPVYPLNEIGNLSWDIAIYACEGKDFDDILPRMVELGIGTKEQFKNRLWLLQQLMTTKYEDCADPEIQTTLDYWKTHEITIYNQYLPTERGTLDKVFFDETCDLPYIYFKILSGEYRKMYYPKGSNFFVFEGKNYVPNILREQEPTSPHLYTTAEHQVSPGDVVIDAGVCEGNFALKYVDICSKMYLFEPSPVWFKAISQTFKNYRDKVEIIPRFVAEITENAIITLDDALPDLRGENIFLKMDIEGAEPRALRGAKRLLTGNKVKASICTYHKADDLVRVKSLLHKYGFKTSTSAGYMVFIPDPKIFDRADFRKGIVYAAN